MGNSHLTGVAFSYVRFSSKVQELGDSVRRQVEARDRWLARNPGVRLDESLTLSDLGVSAFRGKHRANDRAALAVFLKAVESGRVKRGSYLIVESLDRLTREELGDAFELVLGLVNRGIRIVQLAPAESILEKPVSMTGLMLAIVELSRGNSESQVKSVRIGAAWAKKRAAVRESGALLRAKGKAWLELVNGRFVFKPGTKAIIRRIFRMATDGHGCRSIVQTLIADKVPPWTRTKWGAMYVRTLLRGREVLGEFRQGRKLPSGQREMEGEPIAGYYPAAVTEAEWQAAQVAARTRLRKGGRPSKQPEYVNMFQGLLRDAPSGQPLHTQHNREMRILRAAGYHDRGEKAASFPAVEFERAILSQLAEIDPRELFPAEAPDDRAEARAQLARLDAQIRALTDLYDGDDVIPEVAAKLRAKHEERKTLAAAVDAAEREAAAPLSDSMAACRGLVEAIDTAKDVRAVRLRLRQVIARAAERIDCVFVSVGMQRLAAVQVRFFGGAIRDYVVWYKSKHVSRTRKVKAAQYSVRSFAESGTPVGDLRNPAEAVKLGQLLRRELAKGQVEHTV